MGDWDGINNPLILSGSDGIAGPQTRLEGDVLSLEISVGTLKIQVETSVF